MATNPPKGDGHRNGAVRSRTQTQTPSGHYVKRDAKTINKLGEALQKLAEQHQGIKQDASALYEDLGQRLGRYYKIGESKKRQLGKVK